MFDSAQKPVSSSAPVSAPVAPPPVPPIPVAPPPPPGVVHVKSHHKFMFVVPAILVLVTMGVVAYVVSISGNKGSVTEATPTPVASLTPATPVPTAYIDPKATWKSYRSVDSQLSFRYPSELSLKEEKPDKQTTHLSFSEYEGDKNVTFEVVSGAKAQMASLIASWIPKAQLPTEEGQMTISGISGVLVTGTAVEAGEGLAFRAAYIERDNKVFIFIGKGEKKFGEELLFDEIIKTVSLLSPGITEDWKQYTNTTTFYTVKYPADWEVSTEAKSATESATRVVIRKTSGDTTYQNLLIDATTISANNLRQQKIDLTAAELVSSLQNLTGWKTHPTLDFRSIAGSATQIVSGELEGAWQMYIVLWNKNTLIQMSWKDSLGRPEQDTIDSILSTFTFTR